MSEIPTIIIDTIIDNNNKGLFKLVTKFPITNKKTNKKGYFELEFDGFRPIDPFFDGIGFWYQLLEFGDDEHMLFYTKSTSLDYKQMCIDYIDENILCDKKEYIVAIMITDYLNKGELGKSIYLSQMLSM